MRTVDVFYAFPSVLLAIALSGALGRDWQCAAVADAGVRAAGGADCGKRHRPGPPYGLYRGRPRYRGQRLYHYSRPGPRQRAGADFVFSTGLISVCMILASGLSFLAVRPPEPEWGLMLNTLRTAIYTQPWVAALPGLMILSPPFRSTSSLTACARRWRLRSNDATFINIDLGGPAQPPLKVNQLLKYFRAGGAKAVKWCRRWITSALR